MRFNRLYDVFKSCSYSKKQGFRNAWKLETISEIYYVPVNWSTSFENDSKKSRLFSVILKVVHVVFLKKNLSIGLKKYLET